MKETKDQRPETKDQAKPATNERQYTCPGCGKFHNRHIDVSGDRTIPLNAGDLTICNRCGHVGEFNAALEVVPVNESALDADTQHAIDQARQQMFHNPLIPKDRRIS